MSRRPGAAVIVALLAALLTLPIAPEATAAEPDDDSFVSIELADDDWTWEIVVYDGTGGNRRTPVDRPVIGRPALSPDGTQIVFTSWVTDETDGRWGLYIVDVNGSNLRSFTSPQGIDRDPAWSPDGQYIAFSRDTIGSTRPSNCCRIRVKAVTGGFNQNIAGTLGGINPTWSPDGTRLAYQRPDGIQVTDLGGTSSYTLTGAGGFDPEWSPDGDEIAYLRPYLGAWEMAVRPAGGGPDRLRVRSLRRIENPQWDPDGDTIYYLRYKGEGYDGRSETAVWMHRDSDDPVRLYKTDRSIVHLSHHAVEMVPSCDFNADGRSDLAVGIPGESLGSGDGTGAVGVLYAAPSGLDAAGDQLWSQATGSIIGNPADGNAFGTDLACGDFDDDGDADLAVGIPGDTSGTGAVTIIQGSPGGLTGSGDQRWNQATSGILGQPVPGNAFGSVVAAGDIDNDGYADLAVGIPGDQDGAGAVSVLYGGPGGISIAGDQRWHQDTDRIPGSRQPGHAFGDALSLGDYNADGYLDLAVGMPGSFDTGGSVLILYGTSSGLSTNNRQRWHQGSAGIGGSVGDGHLFGDALASGDFNRDGYDDLAIGIPGDKNTAGAVGVLYGTSSGLTHVNDDRWHQDVAGIGGKKKAGNRYGSALAAGDFDADGYDDLAIGIPGDKKTAGAAGVLYGSGNGLKASGDQWWHQDKTGILGNATAGNVFGSALFVADFDADGSDDLAIGAPGDLNRGAVQVLYGGSPRLSATGDQRWHQNTTGIEDTAEPGDAYGGGL